MRHNLTERIKAQVIATKPSNEPFVNGGMAPFNPTDKTRGLFVFEACCDAIVSVADARHASSSQRYRQEAFARQ